jgi:hypothetical protein
MLQKNTFENVGSYIGANVAVITKELTNSVATDQSCDLVAVIKDNTFKNIEGSCQADTGLIRAQCNFTAQFTANAVDQARQVNQGSTSKPLESSNVVALSGAAAKCDEDAVQAVLTGQSPMSIASVTKYKFQSSKFLFSGNSIDGASFGATQSSSAPGVLLDIRNLQDVRLQSNTFSNVRAPVIGETTTSIEKAGATSSESTNAAWKVAASLIQPTVQDSKPHPSTCPAFT